MTTTTSTKQNSEWRIYKYPVPEQAEFELELHAGTRMLSLQLQNGKPTLWAAVNPSTELEKRKFRWIVTGATIPARIGQYIGTVLLENDKFVWHLFEAVYY